MPKNKRQPTGKRKETRPGKKKKKETEQCHEFSRILEEKGRPPNRKFLLEWTDGSEPSWTDEMYIQDTCILQEWDDAEEEGEDIICSEQELDAAVEQLAKWILELAQKQSPPRIVWHIGAGVSASSGVPTFRGIGGLWTRNRPDITNLDLATIQPSYSHYALAALQHAGYVYHIVSQNYDNLLPRAGVDLQYMSGVHGNIFHETCPNCQRLYVRGFSVENKDNGKQRDGFDHCTGRKCDDCQNMLEDTIVHFGEDLNHVAVAHAKSKGASISVAVGTKLAVNPAASWVLGPHKSLRSKGKVLHCELPGDTTGR